MIDESLLPSQDSKTLKSKLMSFKSCGKCLKTLVYRVDGLEDVCLIKARRVKLID